MCQYGYGPLRDEFGALIEFYLGFDSTQPSSGVPPTGEPAVRRWLDRILSGRSAIAWHETRPVGQVVLVADPPEGYELALFVDRPYRRSGIGSRLMGTVLESAVRDGLGRIYVLTENPRMASLARTHGFETTHHVAGQTTLVLDPEDAMEAISIR